MLLFFLDLRALLSKPLLWLHPKVVQIPQILSLWLPWEILEGAVNTLLGKWWASIASPLIQLPEPYFAEIPVAVKTCDDWTMAMKQVACFLPHEWLSWLEGQEQAAGFQELKAFWKKHSREDPKLKGNPILVDPFQHLSFS